MTPRSVPAPRRSRTAPAVLLPSIATLLGVVAGAAQVARAQCGFDEPVAVLEEAPIDADAHDLDGDGHLDPAVTDGATGTVAVLLDSGNVVVALDAGDGTFGAPVTAAVASA